MLRLRWAALAAVLGLSIASPVIAAPPPDLSMVTYNVHGLPWPMARGRSAAFGQIAAQLRTMRAQGRQPHVLLLQEAFTADAKAIGAAAGYRYAAFGPSADAPAPAVHSAGDRRFIAAASRVRGETDGKWTDSGLVIFSDYPIAAVRRMTYPLCAGYDCLANKGVVAVRLKLPGSDRPVFVADTHLNARGAAGVPHARADYAYARQIDYLRAFLARTVPPGAALLVGGDFNVGRAAPRTNAFSGVLSTPMLALASTVSGCAAVSCQTADPASLARAIRHQKDWLLYRLGSAPGLVPTGLFAPFGPDAAGRMLSDHIGMGADFRIDVPRRIGRAG